MNLFEAIIQGIVQGITEFLPISSSGHLSLTQHILGTELGGGVSNLFFTVMLHLGTLAAVCFVYYKLIWRLIRELFSMVSDLFRGRFRWKEMSSDRRMLIALILGLLPLFLFFLPVPGTGMKVKDFFATWASDKDIMIEAFCFLLTGVLLLLAHRLSLRADQQKLKLKGNLTVGDALFVGLTQGVAGMPGISRSGSTLSAGIIRGLDRQTALDYSFILGIPTILAANILEIKDAVEVGAKFELLPIIVGVIFSAVVGFFAIKLLKLLVTKNRLNLFGYYCLALGVVVLIVSIVEYSKGINLFTGTPIA